MRRAPDPQTDERPHDERLLRPDQIAQRGTDSDRRDLGVGERYTFALGLADEAAAQPLIVAAAEALGRLAGLPTAGLVSHSAAKAGISAGLRALAREVRPRGLSVIDARPPHTETGLASRALCGEPPKMREGLDPAVVAERLVPAIEQDERDVPASAFAR